MAIYAVALDSDVCVPLMLVCLSDACVCTIHEHHAEARAALMRVTSEVRLDQATWSSNA